MSSVSRIWFPNCCTSDIWDWFLLCWARWSLPCRMLSSIPGLYLSGCHSVSTQLWQAKMSPWNFPGGPFSGYKVLHYPAHFPSLSFFSFSQSHTGLFQPLKHVVFFPVSWSLHILFHPAHSSSQCQSFRAQLKLCFLKEAFFDYLGPLSYAHMASECVLMGLLKLMNSENHLYHH